MVGTTEDTQPVSPSEQTTKFIWSPKGKILALEIALCLVVILCKAVSLGCFLWCPIVELVWAIIIFVIFSMEMQIRLFPWMDFFRAITASLFLLVTSLVCISWAGSHPGEIVGTIFGLMAAAVFGFDTYCIIKQIKELKEQGTPVNFIWF